MRPYLSARQQITRTNDNARFENISDERFDIVIVRLFWMRNKKIIQVIYM